MTLNSFSFIVAGRFKPLNVYKSIGYYYFDMIYYRKDKLEVEGMYDRADEDDVFEREPFVVRFRRTQSKGKNENS